MLKIGLTGGIGSGKTAVANIFKVLRIPVFDADEQAKQIMENNEKLVLSIKDEFGENSYITGKLNRPHLANIVFNHPGKLKILNSLVHPATIEAANNWMATQTSPYVIKEAALMFESGSAFNLDYVIGVQAPPDLRIKRVIGRDRVTKEQVLKRMENQMNEDAKMKLCNFVIINDDQQLLIPQVLQLHKKFLEAAEKQEKKLF